MDDKTLELLESKFKNVVDAALESKISSVLGPMVADETKKIVDQLRMERALFGGTDKTGLTSEQKIAFATGIKEMVLSQKAALIEGQDNLGGYLVPTEVYAGIMRVAASVGLVLANAQRFPMKTDELNVPRYTGAFLEGGYLGNDEEGSETSLEFGDARLITKTWYTLFRIDNALLADASVDLADWLIGLIAEGMANRIDKEGFAGTGLPFVGLLNDTNATVVTLATGKDTFAEFDLDDCSELIANVEESVLGDAAFFMHRTLWHSLRTKKGSDGAYTVGWQGTSVIAYEKALGVRPVGFIWGYPVFTARHLPALAATAISTKFAIFGSLKNALFYGDRGQLALAKSDSATVGGKNVFAANQTALRGIHRHALSTGLYTAVAIARTAAA